MPQDTFSVEDVFSLQNVFFLSHVLQWHSSVIRALGWSKKGIDTLWLSYTQLTQRRRKKIEKKIHMPEIARFFGIIIRMYAEPNVPHHRPPFP